MATKKICLICGKEFVEGTQPKKFCSKACKSRNYRYSLGAAPRDFDPDDIETFFINEDLRRASRKALRHS